MIPEGIHAVAHRIPTTLSLNLWSLLSHRIRPVAPTMASSCCRRLYSSSTPAKLRLLQPTTQARPPRRRGVVAVAVAVSPRSYGPVPRSVRASFATPWQPEYVPETTSVHDDGEQSPVGAAKLVAAHMLAGLGAQVIEARCLASSPDDELDAVRAIAMEVGNTYTPVGEDQDGHVPPIICGVSGCNKADIDAAWEALRHAQKPRVRIVVVGTGEISMKHMTDDQVVADTADMVAYALSLGFMDVEFSPEDAGSLDRVLLYHILGEVIKSGATSLHIPVGQHTLPHEFDQLIADIKVNTSGIENAIISAPCRNLLGLASDNTIVGVFAGAQQLEVTISGTGSAETAGNDSMEEIVMVMKCSPELLGDLYTGANTQGSNTRRKMVQEQSGLHAQLHNTTVAANADESGVNLEWTEMFKFKRTCQVTSYVPSGRHAIRTEVGEHAHGITEKEFGDLCKSCKVVAEEQKPVAPLDSRMDTTTLLFNIGQSLVVGRSIMDILKLPVVVNTVRPFMRQMAWPCLRIIVVSGFGVTVSVGVMAMYSGAMVILKAGSTSNSSTL